MKATVPSKPTILALIGAGRWGQNYINSCINLPNIKIGYVCTKSKKTLEKLPTICSKTTNINHLLNKENISGFIIASPTSTHYEIAKLLLKKNKNILIEKPIADSLTKTQLLYNLSRKHPKSIVMAGHIQLYDQGYQEIKKQLKKIGKIRKLKYIGLKSDKRPNVGIFWDWCPHPLYLFADITQQTAKVISVESIKPDNLKVTLLFPDMVIGQIHVGWTYPKKIRLFAIEGEKGTISMKKTDSQYSPLQNEILTFVKCIKEKVEPPSNLKQALEIAKTISQIEKLAK